MAKYFTPNTPPEFREKFEEQVRLTVALLEEFTDELSPLVLVSTYGSLLASLLHDGMRAKVFNQKMTKKMLVAIYHEAVKGPAEGQH